MHIANSEPADTTERDEKRELLYTLARILFKDRLKRNFSPGRNTPTTYLQLNHHQTEESAKEYAESVLSFLNSIFKRQNRQGLFSQDSIVIHYVRRFNLYECKLMIGAEQLDYLTKRTPRILDIKASY